MDRLRHEGYSVLYVAEMDPGLADELVLDRAKQTQAVLLTADKDFGELVFRQRKLTSGVILLRLAGSPPLQKAEIVTAAFEEHSTDFMGAFSVITSSNIRIRRVQ